MEPTDPAGPPPDPAVDLTTLPTDEPFATMVRLGRPLLLAEWRKAQAHGRQSLAEMVGTLTLVAQRDKPEPGCVVQLTSRAKAIETYRTLLFGRRPPGQQPPTPAERDMLLAILPMIGLPATPDRLRVVTLAGDGGCVVDVELEPPPAAPAADA